MIRFFSIALRVRFIERSNPSAVVAEQDPLRASLLRADDTIRGFAPETLCGLAFAGANRGKDALGRVPGILTAEELAGLDLSECELAVLSACETNVGVRRAGQGIRSLQAALHAAGARLTVTDIATERCHRLAARLGAQAVAPEAIYDVVADVFAPCALGAIINESTLPRLKVAIIAGAANNQLATGDLALVLKSHGILYAPDYAINAGGIIRVCREYLGNTDSVDDEVVKIYDTLSHLFAMADDHNISTLEAADARARARLTNGR